LEKVNKWQANPMRMKVSSAEKWRLADEEVRKNLPPGVKLVRTLRGHTGTIGRIAWSTDGRMLASPSLDKTIRLWDAETGECLHILRGHNENVAVVAFSPIGKILASGGGSPYGRPLNESINLDTSIRLWEIASGELLSKFGSHTSQVSSLAFDPAGHRLASGSFDTSVELWEIAGGKLVGILGSPTTANDPTVDVIYSLVFDRTGQRLVTGSNKSGVQFWEPIDGKWQIVRSLEGHGYATYVAFDSFGQVLASGGDDRTVKIWNVTDGRLLRTLEGHTEAVVCVDFLPNSKILATKGRNDDNTFRLWHAETGVCLVTLSEPSSNSCMPGLAFHPHLPFLATVGSDPYTPQDDKLAFERRDRVIHIWELDLDILLSQAVESSAHYVNAKVMLLGDTGVGKTGLSLVLNKQPFEATDSTAGRHVYTLNSQEVKVKGNITQTRETLLWDLAGQPGYRVIHQLHLNEVAVALVVFDSRSEIDPLAGVRHWERALRLAQQRQGTLGVPMKKFLVSARNDRGGVSMSENRLQAVLNEFDFDGYFKTSAKEGWQIKELREAIEQAISWEKLPEVSSSQLFADIKSFLLDVKKNGWLLAQTSQLYHDFTHQHPDMAKVANLRDQFDTCIGRLENRDSIRRLTFGGYVLLQPELLDAYASAMVNTAKDEPEGLGSISEEIALAGRFFVPDEQKVKDPEQEQLLLHATCEELLRYDLALQENADDGRYLVFPSQFNRDYEDAPEPKGAAVSITFEGPVQSLYSTLAVRLSYSGLFTTGRAEMWRNAAVFTAKAGGKCGLFLKEFAEARGRLILFFDEHASIETRFYFEEFIMAHAKRRSLDGTLEIARFFVCSNGHPVPDDYVKILLAQGKMEFSCPCGVTVSLVEPKERIRSMSAVEAMEKSANWQRYFEAFIVSAKGETSTKSFHEWVGGERVTLTIVFTEVIGSTAFGDKVRDIATNEVRRVHFTQSRRLIDKFKGREIKTIGDSFMVAFKSVDKALNYAIELQRNTGHPQIRIRAGVHIGSMHVEEEDEFGSAVNFASRVVGSIKGSEIWVTDRAKEDIDRLRAVEHKRLCWKRHDGVALKGFSGVFTLWSVSKADQSIDLSKSEIDELEVNCQAAYQRSRFEQVLSRLKSYVTDQKIAIPECFISYAWGNPDQELWVERSLATDLRIAGIKVVLDRWENDIGDSLPRFIERVGKTDRVIVVGTPLYQKKYENGKPMGRFVLAAEGDLIGNRMIGTEKQKKSVLPILLKGTKESSFPLLLQSRVCADFRKSEAYFNEVFKLLLSLYNIKPNDSVSVELRELLMGQRER
jgi:WD40 repeat protein/class 3 adenylate cyclase/GTPase SAR1 family protein